MIIIIMKEKGEEKGEEEEEEEMEEGSGKKWS